MKLIFCPHCQDIIKLRKRPTLCDCGKSRGMYLNDSLAVYSGDAIPLGIRNSSFAEAIKAEYYPFGSGVCFEAFVIPPKCNTFTKIDGNQFQDLSLTIEIQRVK